MRQASWLQVLALAGLCVTIIANGSSRAQDKDKEKEKVITTKSGLKYVEEKEGTGDEAKSGKIVDVHYTGWLKDGSKFDSSRDNNRKPHTFRLGQGMVIKGWDEGVAGMKVGGKRKLIIPFELAYGEAGRPPLIPPRAELTFDVELMKVR